MNVNFRVLGLDPGGTTGWSCYSAEYLPSLADDSKVELMDHKLTVGHLGPGEHHGELYGLMEHLAIQNFYVVCESFEFRQGKQRTNIVLDSKEYIGVVKLFRDERELGNRVRFHTAGQSKAFTTDQKLKAMGWYNVGMKHANDATRQVVFHLVNYHKRHDLIKSWRDLV